MRVLHGTTDEVTRAKEILAIAGAFETHAYPADAFPPALT
jgi:hypothetical protein